MELTPIQSRGRNLLALALLTFAVPLLLPLFDAPPHSFGTFTSALLSVGPWFLLLYFAWRGGGFSLAVIRFLLFAVGVILLVVVLALVFAPVSDQAAGSARTHLIRWQALPLFGCYAFLCWVLFLSRAVRTYLRHVRVAQRAVDPFPLPRRSDGKV